MEWPADKIERGAISRLIPAARNARTHSEAQVAQIAASIREWGWTNPVLVDEAGVLIAGHGRVLAALKLGLAEIPIMVARGWSEAQKRAYIIADNKLAENAGWDDSLLRLEVADLAAMGFDLPLMGFSADELTALSVSANAGLTDPDEVPETPEEPSSRLGDVWVLGNHRLMCGDSTDADTVARCLNGVVPHLMVTDPPYGVEYDADWRNKAFRADGSPIGGRAIGKVINDNRSDWREAWALFPGDVAYIWHGALHASEVQASFVSAGFELRAQIIWAKSNMVIGRGHYHYQHESCWYAVRKGKTGRWAGDHKQTTLWQIDKPRKSETRHSAQKPVECMKRPIENNSSAGQAVYEPFSGSGPTIIAAEMTGRRCHAVELHPAYVDVAVARWQLFTGQSAALEETGETFAELLARRAPDASIKVSAVPMKPPQKVKHHEGEEA
jgi:DNA modification methylase